MRTPKRPPDFVTLLRGLTPQRLGDLLLHGAPGRSGSYLHWDKLSRKPAPAGLTHEEWWVVTKLARAATAKPITLLDKSGAPFRYCLPDPVPEMLHRIDQLAGGVVQMPEQITSPSLRDRYYVNSLIEEAITSSQLEGATTTREVAKEMIRAGRLPRDRSERMILNNFLTMQRIGGLKAERLTREMVFEIHELVTRDALDNPAAAGRFRRADELVVVAAPYGDEVYHDPPHASSLDERLEAMCAFANDTSGPFLHPAVRSIILHFWLAYDHPFVDGNGRTARALFYWSMLHHQYWLFEFISISQVLVKAPTKYARSFLYTETDDNDLTYFILEQLDAIGQAIDSLYEYLEKKTVDLRGLEARLHAMDHLNHRQQALVSHALRHPNAQYTVESHRSSHRVSYETARSDLMELVSMGLLRSKKVVKTWHFEPTRTIEEVLGGRA